MAGRLFIALCFVALAASSSYAATFTVNSTLDEPDGSAGDGKCETAPGNNVCTLRAAIQEASAISSSAPKIIVPAGTFFLKPLTPVPVINFLIFGQISIEGAGIGKTIIDATDLRANWPGANDVNQYPIFDVRGILNLSKLTIQNSHYVGVAPRGAVFVIGEVNVTEVAFLNNTSVNSSSPAITNYRGTVTIRDSVFINNSALNCGAMYSIGAATITNSTFIGNKATAGPGGAVCSLYTVVSRDAWVSDRMSITNTTFNGNSATREGGAIFVSLLPFTPLPDLKLLNVTFDSNSSPFSASLGWDFPGPRRPFVSAENTIFSNPLGGGENCMSGASPELISNGHNISSDSSCALDKAGDLINTDPLLGPLADNGGLTQTQALLGGSPAIDAGSKNCTVFDQRGTVRPIDGNKDGKAACDVGAVEAPAGGVATFQVTTVEPAIGGNTGMVTVVVRGNRFKPGANVELRENNTIVVTGQMTSVESTGRIRTTLDLTGQPAKSLSLVVVNPDGQTVTAPQPFQIVSGSKPKLSMQLVGPSVVRVPAEVHIIPDYDVYIAVKNSGNVDSAPVIVSIDPDAGIAALAATSVFDSGTLNPIDLVGPTDIVLPPIPSGGTHLAKIRNKQSSKECKKVKAKAIEIPEDDCEALRLAATLVTNTVGALGVIQDGISVGFAASCVNAGSADANCAQTAQLMGVGETSLAITESVASRIVILAKQRGCIDLCRPLKQLTAGNISRAGFEVFNLTEAKGSNCGTGTINNLFCGVADNVKSVVGFTGVVHLANNRFLDTFCVDPKPTLTVKKVLPSAAAVTVPADATASLDTCGSSSGDPNDKQGPSGVGPARYVVQSLPFNYVLRFENKPEATAAAQTVVVTDILDPTKFDLSTFSLGAITFGDAVVNVPSGEQKFVTTVDLRPANNLIVRINADIDLATGIVTWRFESIDPVTQLPTTDPIAGFLPPDKLPPEGQGSLLFSIQPKAGLPSGTIIENKATIVFDINALIDTPTWSNTIDASSPSSAVDALASTQAMNSFMVKWAGSDIDSGLRDYTIFVSVDGGTPTPWLVDTIETSATYTGEVGKTYAFYSVARDNVGNVESAPATPDATTKVVQPTAAGNSSGGGGGGCTIGLNERFDLSFILLLLWFWIPKYSRRVLRA